MLHRKLPFWGLKAKYIKLWAPTNKTCFIVPILPNKKSIPFRITGAPRARSKKDAASPGSHGPGEKTVTAQQVGPGSDEKMGRYAWMAKGDTIHGTGIFT